MKHRVSVLEPYRLKSDGTPFVIAGRRALDCKHGPDHHIKEKEREKAKKIEAKNADMCFSKSRKTFQSSIKHGCPAKIVVRDVISFLKRRSTPNKIRNMG